MNKIHICHGCGRTVDSSFLYCPWCGFSRLNNRETDSLDEVFRQLETVQQKTAKAVWKKCTLSWKSLKRNWIYLF